MLYKIPPASQLQDTQFIQVEGPDGLTTGYQYNAESKTLYFKESQIIIPSFHGISHVAEDPVPSATVDTPGLMSADDKAKLESLIQMRLGVLGFMGAGFPDDGGWMQGDIIMASGSELLSIERIGNVVRFTVDSQIPLNCNCEECAQIYWIQDETDSKAIRPPSCAGVLPDLNAYGELAIYLFPESVVVDPNNVADTIKNKNDYPALIFKRYEDSTTPALGQMEMVLRRSESGTSTVGWSMTPGDPAQNEFAECVWFTGTDSDGNRIRFDLQSDDDPGLFGALLYKGHTLTRKMGVVTDYRPTVLTTNQYEVRYWDIQNQVPVGGAFTATNIWKYNNPENSFTNPSAPKSLALDGYSQVLQVGTLVQLWEMKVSDTVTRRYFNLEPHLTANVIYNLTNAQRFGDVLTTESDTDTESGGAATDVRLLEKRLWGTTWFEDPVYVNESSNLVGPLGNQFVADIDYDLPGLKVEDLGATDADFSYPVFLWDRHNHQNFYAKILVGQPDNSNFPPIDILLRAPIDSYGNVFMQVIDSASPTGSDPYIVVNNVSWDELPSTGTLQILNNVVEDSDPVYTWEYLTKAWHPYGIMLIGDTSFPVSGVTSVDPTVVGLVHEDYNAPCLRLEFSINNSSEIVQLQFKYGILDMNQTYSLSDGSVNDDKVKDFEENNYVVSQWLQQNGFITSTENPSSSPADFRVYVGGYLPAPIGSVTERWNTLELLVRDDQLWVWWNDLIIPPSTTLSPVAVNTPYFPFDTPVDLGKFGLRMWPGTKIRSLAVYDQNMMINEFIHGQLQITA